MAKRKNTRLKTIIVNNNMLLSDQGAFARVYRISSRRIVKVYRAKDIQVSKKFANDEIKGSKIYKKYNALPVLEVVNVIEVLDSGVRKAIGVLKRYIPYNLSKKDYETFLYSHPDCVHPDVYGPNLKKDSRGNIYFIDTQTRKGINPESCNFEEI